jgi:hypothetical protein
MVSQSLCVLRQTLPYTLFRTHEIRSSSVAINVNPEYMSLAQGYLYCLSVTVSLCPITTIAST